MQSSAPRSSHRALTYSVKAAAVPRWSVSVGALVVLCLLASLLSCWHPAVREGAGGQSGDEGRKVRPHWLGTGGVTAE